MNKEAGLGVALVTGASQGIGAATAVALAQAGFDLVVCARNRDSLAATVSKAAATGRRILPLSIDVRSQESIEEAFSDAIASMGKVDVLVNNAGTPLRAAAVDVTRADWDEVISVNLSGTFFMAQQMGRHLIEQGRPGVVINIASTHGLVGLAGVSAYGIAKAGLIQMTRALAIEWAKHGIRVNAVAPGKILTEARAATLDPVREEILLARIPLGRSGTSEETAAAVVYLARPEASYITGHTLVLDGGVTAA